VTVAAPRRRADRDEHRVRFCHGRRKLGREIEPSGLHIGSDKRVEPRLENRDLAAEQARDLALVLVYAGDVVAKIRQAGA